MWKKPLLQEHATPNSHLLRRTTDAELNGKWDRILYPADDILATTREKEYYYILWPNKKPSEARSFELDYNFKQTGLLERFSAYDWLGLMSMNLCERFILAFWRRSKYFVSQKVWNIRGRFSKPIANPFHSVTSEETNKLQQFMNNSNFYVCEYKGWQNYSVPSWWNRIFSNFLSMLYFSGLFVIRFQYEFAY